MKEHLFKHLGLVCQGTETNSFGTATGKAFRIQPGVEKFFTHWKGCPPGNWVLSLARKELCFLRDFLRGIRPRPFPWPVQKGGRPGGLDSFPGGKPLGKSPGTLEGYSGPIGYCLLDPWNPSPRVGFPGKFFFQKTRGDSGNLARPKTKGHSAAFSQVGSWRKILEILFSGYYLAGFSSQNGGFFNQNLGAPLEFLWGSRTNWVWAFPFWVKVWGGLISL